VPQFALAYTSPRLLDGRHAFIFPQRNQPKDTAWRYMQRFAAPVLLRAYQNDLQIDLVNGAMMRLYGADNPDALRGPYLDSAVLDQFGDMIPETWFEVVRLADRGGWATFIGTIKGVNTFWELFQRAQSDPCNSGCLIATVC
jgi:phage terminase large subunit